MVKVSVIVPVYNTEKYLYKCLNSLVNQTLEDIQIIVVNDGTKDKSEEIINEFLEKYNDKILYLKKENGGLSDARNYAIEYACGEYIGFVDSDDYVEYNMFEEMYNNAKKENLDIVECDFIWEYPDKIKNDVGGKYLDKIEYFKNGRVVAWNKLYRATIVKEKNIKFPKGLYYEDIEFFYKLVPYINKHNVVNKNLYHYIQRESSQIHNQTEKTAHIFDVLDNVIKYYKENKIYEKYKEELEYLYIRFLFGSSFLRIIQIKDKKLKKCLLEKSINKVYTEFPKWKQNNILKIKTKKNLYYRTINKFTYKIYSLIFSIFEV